MQNSELSRPGASGLSQAVLLTVFVAALVFVPPSLVERLPSVCLNRLLFGWCPACGSLRALVHLFHGDLAGAVRFHPNVLLTGPVLVLLLLAGLGRGSGPAASR